MFRIRVKDTGYRVRSAALEPRLRITSNAEDPSLFHWPRGHLAGLRLTKFGGSLERVWEKGFQVQGARFRADVSPLPLGEAPLLCCLPPL